MYKATCDVCNTNTNEMYQIFIRRMDNVDKAQNFCVCEKCFHTLFDTMLESTNPPKSEEAKDTKKVVDEIPNIPDIQSFENNLPSSPTFNPINDQMKGMLLKDFLNSAWYLNTTKAFIFKNRQNTEILEIKPYFNRKILHIYMPGKTDEYTVIID